jgi:very-short-patch-repair endonuclease
MALTPSPLPITGEGECRGIMQNRIRTTANIQHRARELRKEPTPAEKVIWEQLRDKRLGGFKFRRQAPMGRFIADFYCPACKLIVEIDGDIHDNQIEEDILRTKEMESFGYRVIRFRNEEILSNIKLVLNKILDACQLPSPRMGRGAGGEGK